MKKLKSSTLLAFDTWIASLFIAIGSLGAIAFFNDSGSSLYQLISGSFLGELKSNNTLGVRLRAHQSMIWEDVSKSHPIAAGDSVFTGSSSTAKVIFKSLVETEIAPSSLVVFNAPSKEMLARFPRSSAVVSVQKGSLKLSAIEKTAQVLIESGGHVFSMPHTQANVDIHVDEKSGEVQAITESGVNIKLVEEPLAVVTPVSEKIVEPIVVARAPASEALPLITQPVKQAKISVIAPSPSPVAQAPSPTPAQMIAVTPSTSLGETLFEISPFVSMNSITSKDRTNGGQASIASSVYAGAEGRYIQKWSQDFNTYLGLKLSYISFEQPSNSAKSIADKSRFLTAFSIGGSQKIGRDLNLGFAGAIEKNLFARGASTTSVAIDSILVPSFDLQLTYLLARRAAFSLNVSAFFEEKLGASADNYEVKKGSLFGGKIGVIQHQGKDDIFHVEISASSRNQSTSATEQTETIYTLMLRRFFPISSQPPQAIGGEK